MKRFLSTLVLAVLTIGFAGAAFAEEGSALFEKKCASCHGKDGKGKTKMGEKLKIEDLTSAEKQAKLTDEQILKTITDGIPEKKMPAFKEKLSADEIKAVAAHVRSLKGK